MRCWGGVFISAATIAVMLASAASVNAQTPGTAEPAVKTMQDLVRDMIFQGVVAAKPKEYPLGKMAGQMASTAGREDLVAIPTNDRPACVATGGDLVRDIVERARLTNIVIINETHGEPIQRHFVGKVLRALAAEGYSIYAGETFMYDIDLAHPDVVGGDGTYTNEPIFGRTVRLAKSLGYKLVGYEETPEQNKASAAAHPELNRIDRRETSQTENLMKVIFSDQPNAKVVIHVGDAHAWERKAPWTKSASVWMAERLKKATARDPLTISQIDCVSPTAGVVIGETRLSADGKPEAGSPVDLYVGHPALTFRDGRPAWRQEAGDKPTAVPAQFLNLTDRVMVEARPEDASLESVPIDRILLFPGEKLPLLLPPGRYRIDGYLSTGRMETAPVIVDVK
jgi:hypothetical protein